MKHIDGLSEIASGYDACLLDLWGVMHDGTALYPGALSCLTRLRGAGKRVIFLSNAPRRAARAQAVLDQLGVARELYDAVVTSGEVGFLLAGSGWRIAGSDGVRPSSYFYIGSEKDVDVLDGLGMRSVGIEEAEFVLNVGFGTEAQSDEDALPELQRARERGIPMLCLNPDMEVVKITGERHPCAGVIARQYEQLGGEVRYIGKPYPEVYRHCMAMLAPLAKERVLAVGDGLNTDILGANRAGIESVLVMGGILKHALEGGDAMAWLAAQEVRAGFVMEGFVW